MLPLALVVGIGMVVLFALFGWSLLHTGLAVRLASLVVDASFFGVALLLFRGLAEHPGGADYAWLLISALAAGAFLHALGVVAWNRDAGFVARATGTVLVLTALIVPSTLTLALPLAALLALATVSSGRTADPR